MAMAMGVASMASVAAVPRNQSSLVCRASASNTGEKQGFLDWFRKSLDKESLRETDGVLGKVDGGGKSASNGKAAPAPKKAAQEKKAGFNFPSLPDFGKK